MHSVRLALIPVVVLALSSVTYGQQPAQPAAADPLPTLNVAVTVIGTTPIPGVGVPIDKLPAPVQVATAAELQASGAIDLSSFLNARLTGVHINEVQGNPYQPDVSYRGYTASPLLGTPQGMSIYLDGVRQNQPFGDVVSWDLIPRSAIASVTLIPGSNPAFGLNTLGGALGIETKRGLTNRGTSVQVYGGANARRAVEFEHGGAMAGGFDWFVTGNLFSEDGWRQDSPSDVRQIFGRVGWLKEKSDVSLSVSHADNALTGNGLQEMRLLAADRTSIYTKPDETDNRATSLTLTARRDVRPQLTLAGTAYYRHIRTNTLNGDLNDDALEEAVYQPGAAERAALANAGYPGVPASGLDAANTPFPFLRCLGNVLLEDEPGEKCNGLNNRTHARQGNGGLSGQLTAVSGDQGQTNQFTIGAAFDRSAIDFTQTSELGYVNPDRGITGLGVFADGVHAGDVDGEPFDLAVDLTGHVQTASIFATDTLHLGRRWDLTASGRFNRTSIVNADRHQPGGGPGSLDGDHSYARLNPAVGVTGVLSASTSFYANYGEASRAPTSIELGCADPASPCKLPNAMAGDPPLEQVVARTVEAGLRGHHAGASWNAGWFRAENTNDILFVASDQTGFGYFSNFGRTRRQGLEAAARVQRGRLTAGAGYTWLDATFQSAEQVSGAGNSSNDEGAGLEGSIDIAPGDRMPLVPRHTFKAYADVQVTQVLSVDVDLTAASGVIARGNENDAHRPDGVYYLGPGRTDPYLVVNLGARYQLTSHLQLFGEVNNLFDADYTTAAQLGTTGFTPAGTFLARPLPPVDGEYPQIGSTFFAPGAPLTAWGGVRVKF